MCMNTELDLSQRKGTCPHNYFSISHKRIDYRTIKCVPRETEKKKRKYFNLLIKIKTQ